MTDGHLSNIVLISHEGPDVLGRDDLRDIAYGLSTSSRHAKSNFQRHTIIINHPIVIREGLKYPPRPTYIWKLYHHQKIKYGGRITEKAYGKWLFNFVRYSQQSIVTREILPT